MKVGRSVAGSRVTAQLTPLLCSTYPYSKLCLKTTFFWTCYIIKTVMFTFILFVWRGAQHPEIYADILVSGQNNDCFDVVILNMKNGSSYSSLPYQSWRRGAGGSLADEPSRIPSLEFQWWTMLYLLCKVWWKTAGGRSCSLLSFARIAACCLHVFISLFLLCSISVWLGDEGSNMVK